MNTVCAHPNTSATVGSVKPASDALLSSAPMKIMGILNVTPDSFSDGGRFNNTTVALGHAREMIAAGADIIDVGGESTRPGSTRISVAAECERILPILEGLKDLETVVSVDTLHAETALAACRAGAQIINDVSGGLYDPNMAEVVARTGALYVCQHWRGTPETMDTLTHYEGDLVRAVWDELSQRISYLHDAGVKDEQIIIDPGLGFAKTAAQSWELVERIAELVQKPFPVLVGASRKRFLASQCPPGAAAAERDLATAKVSVQMAAAKVWAVRVHNVAKTKKLLNESTGEAKNGQ